MKKQCQLYLTSNFVSIPCNSNKEPTRKAWTEINKDNCLDKMYDHENIGILTGLVSGITVVDVDVKDHGLETWNKLIQKHGEVLTPTVRSGSGGLHLYFKYDGRLKSDSKIIIYEGNAVGIDVKNDRGYVVAPPSINAQGGQYQWLRQPSECSMIEIPSWFFGYLKTNKTKVSKRTKGAGTAKNDANGGADAAAAVAVAANSKADPTVQISSNKSVTKPIEVGDKQCLIDRLVDDQNEFTYCLRRNDIRHIKNLLEMLSQDRVDTYSSWIEVGLALFSSSDSDCNQPNQYFQLWDHWSQRSKKYKEGDCETKWQTFQKQSHGLSIGSIHFWAKEDNPKSYDLFKKEECIRHFIEGNKETFAINPPAVISNIKSNKLTCTADIIQNYCPISKKNHEEPSNYIELFNNAEAVLACKHQDCFGEILNNALIPIDEKTMKVIFNTNNNIQIIINTINNNTINNGTINNGTINNYPSDSTTDLVICDAYKIFENEEFNSLMMSSLRGTSRAIAEVLWYLQKNNFNCSATKQWYKFENHRWIIDPHGYGLRDFISVELRKQYQIVLKYYQDLSKNPENRCTDLNMKLSKINKLIESLETTARKADYMTEAAEIFFTRNNNFENLLDQNPFLVGFNNGIYDIKSYLFREGKPDDYVSMTTGYDYIENHTSRITDLQKFLEDIQPDAREREYMLMFFSLGLVGTNTHELFHLFTGTGRNGKSKVMELLANTYGQYFAPISASLLTKEQPSANVPRPELLVLKNKRFVVASEPEASQKLNASFIKLLTGNDSLTTRNLYEANVISFIPHFKIALLCNDIPSFDKNDDAIWTRCRCIEFPTKFVPDPQGPKQRLIDYKLKEKLIHWHQDFMLLLIQKFKQYEIKGFIPTANILRFTIKTKEDNDVFKQYLDDRTEPATGDIHTRTLYEDFTGWFGLGHQKSQTPSIRDFTREIKNT